MDFKCHVCRHNQGKTLFTARDYPGYLVPLDHATAKAVVRADLPLDQCSYCGHLQCTSPDPAIQRLIYETYYSQYSVDSNEALVPHYRKPFEDFFGHLEASGFLPREELLEIGCSGGERVGYFSRYCRTYTGIDPSERIHLARQKNPQAHFLQGYFPEACSDAGFDVVVSQFNLEHILDVRKFLQGAWEKTRQDALLIIQVPDIAQFSRSAQPNFLAHEHIQYFTKRSLAHLLLLAGFEPIAWGPEGASLIVAARRLPQAPNEVPQADADTLRPAQRQKELFERRPALPKQPVVFYGVGPLLFWLLSDWPSATPFKVVDDSPAYEGKYVPAFAVPVQRPSEELFRETPSVILSLNKIYHPRVLTKLAEYGLPLSVCLIRASDWVIEKI